MVRFETGSKSPMESPDQTPSAVSPLAQFSLVLVQLLLIGALVFLFEIEGQHHFFPVLCLMAGGFLVHSWLPMRFRLAFFSLLSIASLPLLLGWEAGLQIVLIGGGLTGICRLPFGVWARTFLLTVAAAGLVVMRVRWPLPIWPILGAMFMFRLMVYVFSTRKAADAASWPTTLAYFFMLPNVCFPLFPVVDYSRFRNSWYAADEWRTYQRGITWITRGLGHLLLYRYIKRNIVPEPYELYDFQHIALFMVTNYALYLRVSGQFHLITGLLHLFGFHLPRTHHNYFLASSFTDIWRRINIYWKDFLTKLFFFPTYYGLHGRGVSMSAATVVGVMGVFLATWLLHSWQTFWLVGKFPVTVIDALLWSGAGVCVAVNALLDARRRKRPKAGPLWQAVSLSTRTAGMFMLVSLFWSCWTNPDFLSLLAGAWQREGGSRGLLVVLCWIVAAVALGSLAALTAKRSTERGFDWPELTLRDAGVLNAVGLAIVTVIALPRSAQLLPDKVAAALAEFRSGVDPDDHLAGQLHGYYEDLNTAVIQAGPLVTSLSPESESLRADAAGFQKISRPADIFQEVELIPGMQTELSGRPISINRFGMRDREDLTLHKPPHTIRIAMVGSSVVMGYGVADDEVFTREVERRLNAEQPPDGPHFEVLNFGVGRQWASQRLVRIQRKVLGFDPDAIFYFAHQDEFESLARHIAALVADGQTLPSEHLQEVVDRAGITPDMAPGAVHSRLARHKTELLLAVYRTIVDLSRERGIVPVYFYLPIPSAEAVDIGGEIVPLAEQAGFVTCDLSSWTDGHATTEILTSADDQHPHAAGHRLIAHAVMEALEARGVGKLMR